LSVEVKKKSQKKMKPKPGYFFGFVRTDPAPPSQKRHTKIDNSVSTVTNSILIGFRILLSHVKAFEQISRVRASLKVAFYRKGTFSRDFWRKKRKIKNNCGKTCHNRCILLSLFHAHFWLLSVFPVPLCVIGIFSSEYSLTR
jgi:hypothetical protein